MNVLHVGIASYEKIKARSIAIARGEYTPKKDEPQIWFNSPESFAKVLSEKNLILLDLIAKKHPHSLAELETLSGRKKSNLSRTLKTMERYDLVSLNKAEKGRIVPEVKHNSVSLTVSLSHNAA